MNFFQGRMAIVWQGRMAVVLQGMRPAAITAFTLAAFIFAAVTSAAAQGGAESAATRIQDSARTQGYAASSVATAKASSPSVPEEAQVGICVRTVSGKILDEDGAEKNFMPASNLKLVTCGAALESLGADFRFRTEIAYSGKVGDDGVLCGDLHIVGGGDPTLGSSDPNAVPRDSLFARWTRAVRAAGIRSIAGSVVGDSRRMRADVNGSWMYEDLATYYGTSCSALMFNRNCLELFLRPGEAEGDPVSIGTETPWIKIENRCVTGPAGSGDQSYLFISEFAPAARLGGTLALNRDSGKVGKTGKNDKTGQTGGTARTGRTISYNNPFADFSCAYEFALHLTAEGIPCKAVTATSPCHPTAIFNITGDKSCRNAVSASEDTAATEAIFGFEVFDTEGSLTYSGQFTPQDSLTTIAVTFSPRLSEIVRETLRVSDNLYAETLLRSLKLSDRSDPHFSADTEEALESLKGILGNLGLNLSRTRLSDGSGLSRKNSISPAFMVSFLTAMSSRPCFKEFLNALNTPGPDEILFSESDSATRRRIRLKSGSMTGVRCYSGYILPAVSKAQSPDSGNSSSGTGHKPLQNGDMTVFAIMINDSTLPQSRLREYIEFRLRSQLR